MYSGIAFTEVSLLLLDNICSAASVSFDVDCLTEFLEDTVLELVVSFNIDGLETVVEVEVVGSVVIVSGLMVVLI